MNILIAPNSMKGSLNAFDFADVVGEAFQRCSGDFRVRKVPVADGGDFTGEVLRRSLNAQQIKVSVVGPLGEAVEAFFYKKESTAIIEMADASGMKLVESSALNPMKASSFGTGQLIKAAINAGCNQVFLAIGGSATVDGGMGMMEALGFTFSDETGNLLKGNGANLQKICKIEAPEMNCKLRIKIISDVDNPLLGDNGAATIFGPQKGATPEMVVELEKGLENWVTRIETECNCDIRDVAGGGAAGGISIPLLGFFGAKMVPGAAFVLETLDFDNHVDWADIVITGEGKIDGQTLNNKAPFAVAKAARAKHKPIFAIGGLVEQEASHLFDGMYSLVNGPMHLEEAMSNAKTLISNCAFELAKTISALKKL